MEQIKTTGTATGTNAAKKVYDFNKKASELVNKNFCDYDFKNDYVLSVRLSYGDDKQQQTIYTDYLQFLKNDLKILNEKNEIEKRAKKQGSYYFIFKKTSEYNNYFEQLEQYIKDNEKNESLQKDVIFVQYKNLLQCKNDLFNENFTIANFELIKDKVKNFVAFCVENELIEK